MDLKRIDSKVESVRRVFPNFMNYLEKNGFEITVTSFTRTEGELRWKTTEGDFFVTKGSGGYEGRIPGVDDPVMLSYSFYYDRRNDGRRNIPFP